MAVRVWVSKSAYVIQRMREKEKRAEKDAEISAVLFVDSWIGIQYECVVWVCGFQ